MLFFLIVLLWIPMIWWAIFGQHKAGKNLTTKQQRNISNWNYKQSEQATKQHEEWLKKWKAEDPNFGQINQP